MISVFDQSNVAMFLSADLAGATAFKSENIGPDGEPRWLDAFETLFQELPLRLVGAVAMRFLEAPSFPKVEVWKVMGDEIIFLAGPLDAIEAKGLILGFCDALAAYSENLTACYGLRIRGCCWSARIGSGNRIVEIREMTDFGSGRPYVDFLGPDVDLGFRLCSRAAPGEVVVAPSLAEAVLCVDQPPPLPLRWKETASLKGIHGGRPVPILGMRFEDNPMEAGNLTTSELRERLAQAREALSADLRYQLPGPDLFAGAEASGEGRRAMG
jgi:hypothetical protein